MERESSYFKRAMNEIKSDAGFDLEFDEIKEEVEKNEHSGKFTMHELKGEVDALDLDPLNIMERPTQNGGRMVYVQSTDQKKIKQLVQILENYKVVYSGPYKRADDPEYEHVDFTLDPE